MPDKISPQVAQTPESVAEPQKQAIVAEIPVQAPAKTSENKVKSTVSKQETETITFSENARNFCEFTHVYLRQYIELADQKAAFLFAIVSAISGYIITSKVSPFAIPINWDLPLNWVHFSGKASLLLFLISAIACTWVVLPRLRQNDKPGLIFWGEIVAVNSADEYAKMIGNNKNQATSYGIATHVHTLAVICNRKYFWLKIGMYTAFIGLILFALYLWPILPTIAGGGQHNDIWFYSVKNYVRVRELSQPTTSIESCGIFGIKNSNGFGGQITTADCSTIPFSKNNSPALGKA